MERSELRGKAKSQLKGRWPLAIGTMLVAAIIMSIFMIIGNMFAENSTAVMVICYIISFLIGGSITIGICQFTLNMAGEGEPAFADIFSGFNVFLKAFVLYLLIGIAATIGFCILIIPGIIVSLMLSQSFYIMADNKDMSAIECMKKSMEMMKGHKWEYFVLILSFIGWAILSCILCGLGYLWLMPYQQVTFANYYLELKKEAEAE